VSDKGKEVITLSVKNLKSVESVLGREGRNSRDEGFPVKSRGRKFLRGRGRSIETVFLALFRFPWSVSLGGG